MMPMPHQRARHLFSLLLKRRKLWPVIGILGPRQVGKSTLLREQIAPKIHAKYITLDRKDHRDRAGRSPDYFLKTVIDDEKQPIIVDEVQKVPELFDAIKSEVDEARRPGKFLLTGSTEFSRRTGIRESLTGRIGLVRLFPLTTREANERSLVSPWVTGKPVPGVSPAEANAWFERGGMPGICFLRSAEERGALFDGYLDTTCFRDLEQIVGSRLSGNLAREILSALAHLETPSATEVAAKLKSDTRRIKRHIEALEAVFMLHRLDPHPAGIGKPLYYLFDAGLASHLGASFKNRLAIWAINECLAQHEYSGKPSPRLRYYESTKHSHVDLVIEAGGKAKGVLLVEEAVPGPYFFRTVEAFQKRMGEVEVRVLAPSYEVHREKPNVLVVPWTMMA